MTRMTRRSFLQILGRVAALTGLAGLGGSLAGCGATPTPRPQTPTAGLAPATITPSVAASPTSSPSTAVVASPMPSPTATRAAIPSPTAVPPTPVPTVVATATPLPRTPSPTPGPKDLAIIHGPNPEAITRAAVAALGGMERFVKKGQRVIIKPNICVSSRTPEYAATTNPEVVGAVAKMCLEAGAKDVRAMDTGFSGTPKDAYERSGIREAVERAGGKMELMSEMKYREVAIPKGRDIKKWMVYQDILETDVLIDVPIAKHHSNTRLTLGMKNLMGVVKDRGSFHQNLDQRIADLTSLVMPDLTVMDAVRILMAGGPTGGLLENVRRMDTVIAGLDIVAVDSYTTGLFKMTGEDIGYIRIGYDMGLGQMDWKKLRLVEENIS